MTQENKKSRAIGIDLGTTNSVVAYVNIHGQAEVIPSREGNRTTPSVVSLTEGGETFIGARAVREELLFPASTIRSIKRKMGTSERVSLCGNVYSPEEISSFILVQLKKDAEEFLGETVTEAVITVPAYFDNNQRMSTKLAGELAGLKVLRIINEPTAAAVAYGLGSMKNETVLVYDLGGGTFDVTILKITDDGVFEVLATAGDTALGGDDFDGAIFQELLSKLKEDYDVVSDATCLERCEGKIFPSHELNLDSFAITLLRNAAEQAKKDLSSSKSASVLIPMLGYANGKPVGLRTVVTRDEFEIAIGPMVERTHACVQQAMEDAELKPKDVDEVVFVGGSTRVPLIEQKVTEWACRKPNRSVNPDEAVALGAAVQAGMLSGQTETNVLLLDVTPLTLGLETMGGVMTPMIKRNTTIPSEYSENFTTAEDSQKKVEIRVFQGERPKTKDNHYLGEFALNDLPAVPRGVPQIEVRFLIDRNGILDVKATDNITGLGRVVTITGSSSLTSDEVSKMLADAEANTENDAVFAGVANARAVLTDHLHQVESLLRDSRLALTDDMTEELTDLKASIEDARTNSNIELLHSLAQAALETIKSASALVYAAAEELSK